MRFWRFCIAQELFGYLQTDLLIYIARQLNLPPSRVFGVATFYHFFTFKPKMPTIATFAWEPRAT